MGRVIGGLLDNDSVFGKIMTRCGILIGANVMFVIFSIPVVTIGPAWTALHFVMMKTLQSEDGVVNPFAEFWRSFRRNFRQGILAWLLIGGLAFFIWMDVWICGNAGGALEVLKYPLSALGIFLVIFAVYFFPVLAAFEDTLPHLTRNAVFFAARRPLKMLLIVLLHIVPVGIVYLDTRMNPLYAFLGATCAFAGIAMASSSLLMKDFAGFLPAKEGDGKERGAPVQSQKEILREIKRLGQ